MKKKLIALGAVLLLALTTSPMADDRCNQHPTVTGDCGGFYHPPEPPDVVVVWTIWLQIHGQWIFNGPLGLGRRV